jgi:hypothetical protein
MRLALATLLMLATAPAIAAEIDCEGVFKKDATLADFEAAFGKENIVTGTVPGPEGFDFTATTVFPGDPEREMQIRWWDEENLKFFAGVTLAKGDTGPGGVKLGMPIDQVERINGEPFTLWGFFWDYGGGAGFMSGKLADLPGECFLNLHFTPMLEPLPEDISIAISGDIELRSDQKEVLAAEVVVDEINLGYAFPPELEEGFGGDEDGTAE